MSWILTFTGKQFFFDHRMTPESICVVDLAHALSCQGRFNGHLGPYFSVAQHSINVAGCVHPENALWGLLHDAAEAYLSDVPAPVKVDAVYVQMQEERILRLVADAFDLPLEMPAEVKFVDKRMCITEKNLFMEHGTEFRFVLEDSHPPYTKSLLEQSAPLTPQTAEFTFLETFIDLAAGAGGKLRKQVELAEARIGDLMHDFSGAMDVPHE